MIRGLSTGVPIAEHFQEDVRAQENLHLVTVQEEPVCPMDKKDPMCGLLTENTNT